MKRGIFMIKTVKVSHESRILSLGKAGTYGLGVENDNLYDTLYFEFDEMVDGVGELLTSIEDSEGKLVAFPLQKEDNGYSIVVTDAMLTQNQFNMQLMVTNGEVVWHSVMTKVRVKPCLEAGEGEMPTAVEVWLEEADAKLGELEIAVTEVANINIAAEKVDDTTTVTITDRDGVQTTVSILDGKDGQDGPAGADGKDATINGVNTLTMSSGTNIELAQDGSNITVNFANNGVYATTEYVNALIGELGNTIDNINGEII